MDTDYNMVSARGEGVWRKVEEYKGGGVDSEGRRLDLGGKHIIQ